MVLDIIIFSIIALSRLSVQDFTITIISALLLSILTGLACHFFYKLWNKAYKTTLTHKIVSIISSILSFLFVITFVGFMFLEEMAKFKINEWEKNLVVDKVFDLNTFKIAYYKVKKTGKEDFSEHPRPEDGGRSIPATKTESIVICAKTTYDESIKNFKKNHPTLSSILNVKSKGTTEEIKKDVEQHFKEGHQNYPVVSAIKIAAKNLRDALTEQAPRIVFLGRTVLIICFILVQLIPFGIISYSAYKDLKIRN